MRVLGIDPGLRITGYGCIEGDLAAPSIVEAGVFRLTRGRAVPSIADRLVELEDDFLALLKRCRPEVVAIEGLFAHYRHPATAVVMAHARGVLLAAVTRARLEVVEVKPASVKKAVTGSGRADKAQMQEAVRDVFGLSEVPEPADVADALAIAMCAAQRGIMDALPASSGG